MADYRRFRIESWESDGIHHVLCLAEGMGHVHSFLLTCEAETGHMRYGEARFPLPLGVMQAARERIAENIPTVAAERAHMALFGLPHSDLPPLVDVIGSIVWQVTGYGFEEDNAPLGRLPRIPSAGVAGCNRLTLEEYGYASPAEGRRNYHAGASPVRGIPGPLPMADEDETPAVALPPMTRLQVADAIKGPLLQAMLPIQEAFDESIAGLLGPHWSPAGHAFYAVGGETGTRRRQAAALYPAFAPMFAAQPRFAGLIDAGRPYEEHLRQVLQSWLVDEVKPPVTPALVRRMRTMGKVWLSTIQGALVVGVHLPLDWLPRTRREWRICAKAGLALLRIANRIDTDLARLLEPTGARWEDYESWPSGVNKGLPLKDVLKIANDVTDRFKETLLHPLCVDIVARVEGGDRVDWDRAFPPLEGPDIHSIRQLMANLPAKLLFQGRTLGGIVRVSDAWHERLHAFEASLGPVSDSSWPALTAPFSAGNGLMVVPLATQAELTGEGCRGTAADGSEGLNHCVGGYARRCLRGQGHILSVRRPLGDGRFERLSTIEMVPSDGPCGPQVRLSQHFGPSNAKPSDTAKEAVAEFLAGIENGSVVLSEEAMGQRAVALSHSRESLERAFAAWRPYMPKPLAEGGLDGLREMLREQFAWTSPRNRRLFGAAPAEVAAAS